MLFNSFGFMFVFLPVALILFFSAAKISWTYAKLILCISSLCFYAWWNVGFLWILIASVLFNFGISLAIERAPESLKSIVLALGVAGDLAALAYYKYALWLVSVLAGAGFAHSALGRIVLPLGISFFTFTQIGYLVDVRVGAAKERGFINYLLFVTFFPHLIAGPILHHREVMPQFAEPNNGRLSGRHMAVGLTLFLAGLFKKTVIADGLQPIVATGYAQSHHIGAGAAWLTMIAYSAQLYFDFSGYSDMAIGIARMFNIKFPINFNSPYKASNIVEYWSRWHMTLTRYLNAYLYNPVAVPITRRLMSGASARENPRSTPTGFLLTVALPTFWTMTLAGLWHGVGAQFLVFGLLHATFITLSHLWDTSGASLSKPKRGQRPTQVYRIRLALGVGLTMACTTTAALFFRAPDLHTAFDMLRGAYGLHGAGTMNVADGFTAIWQEVAVLVAVFAIIWGTPNLYEMLGKDSPVIGKVAAVTEGIWRWRFTPLRAALIGLVGALGVMFMGRTTEFIYFQF